MTGNFRNPPYGGYARRPLVSGRVALPLSPQTVFVGVETARASLGVDIDAIKRRVESGALQWVFNLAAQKGKRELRFWAYELCAPGETDEMRLPQVLQALLGGATRISRGHLELRWVVSHSTVGRWISNNQVKLAAPGWVSRASLEIFLTDRWMLNQENEERDDRP